MSASDERWGALDWPEQWARDEKFWREVATRTVSGVLALLIVGVPSVVYLWLAGQLRGDTAVPILIGVGLVSGSALLWWVTRRLVRVVQRRQLTRVVRQDPNVAARAPLSGRDVDEALEMFLRQPRQPREQRDLLRDAMENILDDSTDGVYERLADSTKLQMGQIRVVALLTSIVAQILITGAIALAGAFLVR